MNGQDILAFTAGGGVTGSFNTTTGVLNLTGNASVADYQAALRTVTYFNSSNNPTAGARSAVFQVDDGQPANNLSNTDSRAITVVAVNDAPTVTDAGAIVGYTENGPALLMDSTLTLADAESNSITSAVVTISANFISGHDVLAFTDSGADNISAAVISTVSSEPNSAMAASTNSNGADGSPRSRWIKRMAPGASSVTRSAACGR